MNEYKITQLEKMLCFEEHQSDKNQFGAHLTHWSGNGKPINIDAGALRVLIDYYKAKGELTMNKTVQYIFQQKIGREYTTKYICNDVNQVYEDLSHELVNKKINECRWIKSIKRTPLYNGFQKITVQYDDNSRRVYTITDH